MNHRPLRRIRPLLVATLLATLIPAAWAGRPLAVDDANVNDTGHGHVELWAARAPGSTVFNLAPAYAPVDGLEFSGQLSRERGGSATSSAVQAKWRITPSQDNGCNVGVVLGVAHVSNGGGNAAYLNGLASCNDDSFGSVHFNLGGVKPNGGSATATWGVAIEKAFGPVTPHIEWFGAQHIRPTLAAGLRGDVAKGIQLDGSIGHSGSETLYTLGMKFSF